MIGLGTFVLLLTAGFFAYRGRPVIAGFVLCIAIASTSAGATGIHQAKSLSTGVGTTGKQIFNSFVSTR